MHARGTGIDALLLHFWYFCLCVLCDSQHAYMSYFERRREKAIESEKAEQALMDQAAQDADVDDIKATP